MSAPRAIVVGAGIGGLAAALDLSRRGLDVTVVERAARAGGKMRQIRIHDARIDSGPTVFTMPEVFRELFRDAGGDLTEQLTMQRVDLLARHAWTDGGRLDLFADAERTAEAIRRFAGPRDADGYRAFCKRAGQVFRVLERPFIRSQRPGVLSLIAAAGPGGLLDLWRVRPFRTLWRELGDYFVDPRLRGLFARYATYCGADPMRAPATLMLIAHVEQSGVWRIEGGMQRLADALSARLERLGGELRYETAVAEVEVRAGRAIGVRLETGESLAADVVVANTDAAAIRRGLLGPALTSAVARGSARERSLSAVTWSMVAETAGFELAHHNVFFPADYPREFDDIFSRGAYPASPAAYLCAQHDAGSHDPNRDPKPMLIIANAPAVGDRPGADGERIESMQAAVFELLQRCGLTLRVPPDGVAVTTPADFEQRFPGSGGALYGMPPHGWRASFTRPGARTRIRGLYLAGGSAHPGAGVPMAALSGRLASQAAAADLDLAGRR